MVLTPRARRTLLGFVPLGLGVAVALTVMGLPWWVAVSAGGLLMVAPLRWLAGPAP